MTTSELTCPHCGAEYPESETLCDWGELICPHCEGTFQYTRNCAVTYTTHVGPIGNCAKKAHKEDK